MPAAHSVRQSQDEISVVASFSTFPPHIRPPRCRAFVFSQQDVLLGSELLDGEGRTRLRWPSRGGEPVRLLLAPAMIPAGMISEESLLQRLRDLGALDRMLPVDMFGGELPLPVGWMRWRDWLARTDCISGQLLAVGDDERVVVGARIELHAVSPLQTVLRDLSADALAHIRQLLVQGPTPLHIYAPSRHVADRPQVGFDDIERLRDAPGFELLTSAARLQADPAFRQLLANYPAIARPLLAYYHPCSFSSSCLGVVNTDSTGMFRFPVLRHGDPLTEPGYYFVARRAVSSSLFVSLYEPSPISWYTHWDLRGCALVTLRSSHPFAIGDPVTA